jgi:hypothetical protein
LNAEDSLVQGNDDLKVASISQEHGRASILTADFSLTFPIISGQFSLTYNNDFPILPSGERKFLSKQY